MCCIRYFFIGRVATVRKLAEPDGWISAKSITSSTCFVAEMYIRLDQTRLIETETEKIRHISGCGCIAKIQSEFSISINLRRVHEIFMVFNHLTKTHKR